MVMRFGRYEVKRELGRGGMGTVYLAHDPRFDRDVALKVMPPGCLQDPTFGERFEREARLIARLEHGAIVPVHDYGEDNHLPFLVMRLMTGGSLADRLQEGPLPLDQAIAVTRRICEALDKAHALHIIHRDLKPANILFDEDGAPFLADFGIARVVEATQTMTVIGTPQYMAPEQAHGHPVDARTDVYQMGVVLFEMLTGNVPFDATTPAALLHQHAYAPIPSPRDFKADLPPGCEAVIQKALAKDPDERYPTALALAEAVAGLKDGARVALPPERPARPGRNAAAGTAAMGVPRLGEAPAGRRRLPTWAWALGGILALLAVAGAVVLPLLNRDGEGEAEGTATAVAAEGLSPSRMPAATPSATTAPSPVPTATRTPAASSTARPTGTATRTSRPTSTSTRPATPTPVRTATGAPASPTTVAATASVVAGRVAEIDVVYHDGFEMDDGSAIYVQGTTPWLDLLARIGGTWYGPERWPNDGINALPLPAGYAWQASGAFAANPNGEAWWTGAGTEGRAWLSAGGVTVAEVTLKIVFRGTSGGDGDEPASTPGGTGATNTPTSYPTSYPTTTPYR